VPINPWPPHRPPHPTPTPAPPAPSSFTLTEGWWKSGWTTLTSDSYSSRSKVESTTSVELTTFTAFQIQTFHIQSQGNFGATATTLTSRDVSQAWANGVWVWWSGGGSVNVHSLQCRAVAPTAFGSLWPRLVDAIVDGGLNGAFFGKCSKPHLCPWG
jgi:hypothetical protein